MLETGKSPRLGFTSSIANTDTVNLAFGYSVRCVQVFTAALLILFILKH